MTDTRTQLLTGWEPDAPADDTVARQAVFALVARGELTARGLGGQTTITRDAAMADLGLPGMFGNHVVLLRPDALGTAIEQADGFIPRERQYLLWSPFPTGDLSGRGLEPVGHPPLMWRPTSAPAPSIPAGLHVAEVSDAEGLATFERTLVDAYPLPEWAGLAPGSIFAPALLRFGQLRCWIGWMDGRPVCTAVATVHAGVNLVEWVSTTPDARGRGYGAAITWTAATAEPHLPAVLLASDDGRSVYERLGFVAVGRWDLWTRPTR